MTLDVAIVGGGVSGLATAWHLRRQGWRVKVLERQVRVEGPVERLPRDESEEYFSSRPRGSQIGAWASAQSRRLASREELEAKVREYEDRFTGGAVPLPEHWGGYRLRPGRIEFWQGRANRLHDRLAYTPGPEGGWVVTRLQP